MTSAARKIQIDLDGQFNQVTDGLVPVETSCSNLLEPVIRGQ